ncbi:hypothetical protein ANCDUO_00186 [Ancylostoma duodenale]|uniref:Uncharacterized protein n=1 Tax=Ancylostoma duodenale TaxID=51022 RepID=A0A0C2HCQ1_9BILA|nr:hypothetical protein ANCDUO_00186 [Ancylostoma duodenale]
MIVQQATYFIDNRELSVQLATTIGHHKFSYRVLERRQHPFRWRQDLPNLGTDASALVTRFNKAHPI